MLEKLKFNCSESYNQCNTLTPYHTRFEVEIERKETHQKIAFEGCKKAYQDVKEFFTPREIYYLRRKMEREGR